MVGPVGVRSNDHIITRTPKSGSNSPPVEIGYVTRNESIKQQISEPNGLFI